MGATSIVQLLCGLKVNVEPRNRTGDTPLHMAATNNHIETVKRLINHGANTNTKNAQNRNAPDLATLNHCQDVYAFLNPKNPRLPRAPNSLLFPGLRVEEIDRAMAASPSPEKQAQRLGAFQTKLDDLNKYLRPQDRP